MSRAAACTLHPVIHAPVTMACLALLFALPFLLLQALDLLHPLTFLGLPALLQFGGALGQCLPVDPLRGLAQPLGQAGV
jgi:hypothetical protein